MWRLLCFLLLGLPVWAQAGREHDAHAGHEHSPLQEFILKSFFEQPWFRWSSVREMIEQALIVGGLAIAIYLIGRKWLR